MELGVEFTLFRVGEKGAYAVTPEKAFFCGSIKISKTVDPTGCGNCATGAAMYAHVSGKNAKEAVVMANIAAGYNAAQLGPYPRYTDLDMDDAKKLLEENVSFVEEVA
jgi:sugar/nucleoside kinase (ribokinase family)